MTPSDKQFLDRINTYARETLKGVNPEKLPVSEQLNRLRPVMQHIAMENSMSVEDVFVKYMDLSSKAKYAEEAGMRAKLENVSIYDFGEGGK